jgi:ATP-dependent Clp protease ATP-binding subunit ClpA
MIMFERYTEKARRVIFFARYEASAFGASQIEAEHILLALFREYPPLAASLSHHPLGSLESVRKEIGERSGMGDRIPLQIDLPLSAQGKRVLSFAAEESERLGDRHIGAEHLLLGLLREEKSIAGEILYDRGLRLADMRQNLIAQTKLRQSPSEEAATVTGEVTISRPVTQKLSLDAVRETSRDERWMRELTEACCNAGLFTIEELALELEQVLTLRQFGADAEALLRMLAAKGAADPQHLPKLAVDLRDDKKRAEFIQKL